MEQVLEDFLDGLPEVVHSGHNMFHARYRMGVRWIPVGEPSSPEALFSDADAALLRHGNRNPGERYVIYDQQVHEQQKQILKIEERLREAMHSDARGLSIHLQPKVEMGQRRIIGAEALLRWDDPELGLISPGRFVPIAEQSGLIFELGQWVVGRVLGLLASWRDDPVLGQLHLALNAAPEEFQYEFYSERILQGLSEHGVAPERLEVEVTERVLAGVQDVGRLDGLGQLRRAGVAVSLDDFGTGYSSLGYLASMLISRLKIDKRFVDAVPPQTDSEPAMAGIIVNLAEQLGLECVAEGVESVEQADWLLDAGCRYAQGYYYARPMPVEAFIVLARSGLGAVSAKPAGQA
ncbi:EAL domain-containing protein [Thioalkalivibrio sp.]|uniref:EAL domain-containing protein n=1 Tax=Thioalkalivibrio sp. TaxID=2093813 RepID=UPI0035635300